MAVDGPVSIRRDAPAWVDLPLRSGAPRFDDVEVTVAGPPELVVTYPGDGAFSGLSRAPSLRGGATDHAAVHLGASALEPGPHTLSITITYTAGGPGSVTVGVPLAVS